MCFQVFEIDERRNNGPRIKKNVTMFKLQTNQTFDALMQWQSEII